MKICAVFSTVSPPPLAPMRRWKSKAIMPTRRCASRMACSVRCNSVPKRVAEAVRPQIQAPKVMFKWTVWQTQAKPVRVHRLVAVVKNWPHWPKRWSASTMTTWKNSCWKNIRRRDAVDALRPTKLKKVPTKARNLTHKVTARNAAARTRGAAKCTKTQSSIMRLIIDQRPKR